MKKLCKIKSKDIEKDLKKIAELVDSPKYICGKCGRAANDKKSVCHPVKIEDL